MTAWILLVSTIAIHVLDEAIADFLSFFLEAVEFEQRFGVLPASPLIFGIWISGLVAFIVIFFCLTPMVKRGGRFIRVLTTILGILMVLNALGHITGSIYYGWLIPGFWSSPFLLLAALHVIIRGLRGQWKTTG